MSSSSAVVTPDVVRSVAALARLRVPEAELPRWTEQLSRIVGYIEQLRQIPENALARTGDGPPTPARPDEPRDGRGEEALAANASRRMHDYGVVPRVVGTGSGS
jgi:aspartyl-tRNA(Asn)/glutamyl-tRNA(Gln) amidotransferase subunit C